MTSSALSVLVVLVSVSAKPTADLKHAAPTATTPATSKAASIRVSDRSPGLTNKSAVVAPPQPVMDQGMYEFQGDQFNDPGNWTPAHVCSFWGIMGLPTPHVVQGGMHQHIPYVAAPKSYYYFRPYNPYHIGGQQNEVQNYGGDPHHPYRHDVFESVYARMLGLPGDTGSEEAAEEIVKPSGRK